MPTAFVAYPNSPEEIGKEIEAAIQQLGDSFGQHGIHSWIENDICGRFLVEPILEHIRDSDFFVADVTRLNFNVAFEIGYSIGRQKRAFLVRHSLVLDDAKVFPELGIFDTLGYSTYSNGAELSKYISDRMNELTPISLSSRHSGGRPHFFLIEPPRKDTYDIALKSALKKARLPFEGYDPQEKGRLPAKYAIESICFSDALVARLLAPTRAEHLIHNIRVAFCVGIAQALEREFLLLQDTEYPVPLDYRELVQWIPDPKDISPRIGELALKLWDYHHSSASSAPAHKRTSLISKVDFGSPIAENEGRQLTEYYLEIAEFRRAQHGEYQAITGRKGSGKTAFFLELRNSLKRNPNNVILDLQPEGYQLLKFRETVLANLAEGSKQHLLTALWEYVLLLEIAHRILRDDKAIHVNDHTLLEPYHDLASFFNEHRLQMDFSRDGDFAERLESIMVDVTRRLRDLIDPSRNDNVLSYPNITELLHRCDIHELSALLCEYIQHKLGVWILVDNLDKGWPATGLKKDDLTLIRCLQDALWKIEKPLLKKEVPCRGILFLRSDVYDRLTLETPDKGKTLKASLDLSNREILREIIRRRIAYSTSEPDVAIDDIWPKLCVSHVSKTGEDSFEFLLDRSLMRPRGIIEVVRSCQSTAVTLLHDRIEERDLKDGLEAYSVELATNIGLEIRDVYPNSPEVIYALLGSDKRLKVSEVRHLVVTAGLSAGDFEEYFDLLLRYGVIGLVDASGNAQYIFDHRYEIRRLKATHSHLTADADGTVEVNPAFWSALDIDEI